MRDHAKERRRLEQQELNNNANMTVDTMDEI
jgi:hypothetical protein